MRVTLEASSRAAAIYGAVEAHEAFHCNYGLAADSNQLFDTGALRIVGWGDTEEARIVEITDAPFYMATLFLPQLAPPDRTPHPLIAAFLQAMASGR